jgi:exocyst complex component 1
LQLGKKIPGLETYIRQSKLAYENNLHNYCRVVTRRPLGKLLEFFEGIQDLLKSQAAEEVPYHLQYSKTSVREIVKRFPEKEVSE